MIIGIAGKKGSGKDTLGEYLVNKYGYTRYAFGDPVKEISKILFGFNDEQLYGEKKEEMTNYGITPRTCFQKIGTEFGRDIIHNIFPELNIEKNNLWIEIFNRKCNDNINLVITDVRFENEVNAIKKQGGKIIYIDSVYSDIYDEHISENNNLDYDFLINNDYSKQELYNKMDKIIKDLY